MPLTSSAAGGHLASSDIDGHRSSLNILGIASGSSTVCFHGISCGPLETRFANIHSLLLLNVFSISIIARRVSFTIIHSIVLHSPIRKLASQEVLVVHLETAMEGQHMSDMCPGQQVALVDLWLVLEVDCLGSYKHIPIL